LKTLGKKYYDEALLWESMLCNCLLLVIKLFKKAVENSFTSVGLLIVRIKSPWFFS